MLLLRPLDCPYGGSVKLKRRIVHTRLKLRCVTSSSSHQLSSATISFRLTASSSYSRQSFEPRAARRYSRVQSRRFRLQVQMLPVPAHVKLKFFACACEAHLARTSSGVVSYAELFPRVITQTALHYFYYMLLDSPTNVS